MGKFNIWRGRQIFLTEKGIEYYERVVEEYWAERDQQKQNEKDKKP